MTIQVIIRVLLSSVHLVLVCPFVKPKSAGLQLNKEAMVLTTGNKGTPSQTQQEDLISVYNTYKDSM